MLEWKPARRLRRGVGRSRREIQIRAALPGPHGRDVLAAPLGEPPVVLVPGHDARRVPGLQVLRQAEGLDALHVPHGLRRPKHDRGLAAAPINRGTHHRVLRRRVTFFDTLDLSFRRLRDPCVLPCVRSDSSEATHPSSFAQSTHSLLSRTPRGARTPQSSGPSRAGDAASARGST